MKLIAMKNNDGQYVGLLLDPLKEEDIVGEAQLKRLQPYISSFLDKPSLETARGRLEVTVLSESKAAFSIEGESGAEASELLSKIRDVCNANLTEKLIVPQYMGDNAPSIRHRVMQFEVIDNQMVVKYVTLGDFNNFDAAMLEVAQIYPTVETDSI